MKNSTKLGIIVCLAVLLALSFSVAYAGNDKTNATKSVNNTTNVTKNITMPQNMTNVTKNMTNATKNITNGFKDVKGLLRR
jgi:hypothetical protein